MFSLYFLVWPLFAVSLMNGLALYAGQGLAIRRSIFLFVLTYLMSWWMLPPFALDMAGTWLMAGLVAGASGALLFAGARDNSGRVFAGLGVFCVILISLLFGGIASSGFFQASRYANLATVVDHGQKETTLPLVSQDMAQRVTSSLALKRAEELIGASQESGLRSRAEFGEMFGNVTPDGNPVWMAPLEPSSFFRWWSNRTTPGYFIASHVNSADSRLVEDKPIAYGTGFYLSHNLERHLYLNGYINYSYGEVFFQIDDQGTPHYVVPLERPQVVMGGYMPEMWLVIDAHTGAITEFTSAESLPTWVDRAYPVDTMYERFDDWGCYSQGFWACVFSKANVIEATPGMIVTMDTNRNMVYYTGTQFASASGDEEEGQLNNATSGVATVNARTGQIDFYRRAGITEQTAVSVINGAVSDFAGWQANFPLLIQVNGLETYFTVIVDGSGAQKGYGMVWQRNQSVYGNGDTVEEAMREYLRRARANRQLGAFEGNAEVTEIEFTGEVQIITPVTSGGETSFYLRIAGVPDKVFLVSSVNPGEVSVTQAGERVRVTAINADPAVVEVSAFDNLGITLRESSAQTRLNDNVEATNRRNDTERQRGDLEARIEDPDAESVTELLEATE